MTNKASTIFLNSEDNLHLNVLYARHSEKDDDWHSTTHIHPFTELFYCVKGKGEFIAEDGKFIMEEDDLLIVNSNIRHTEVPIENEEFGYVVIGIEGLSILPNNSFAFGDFKDDMNYSNYIESFVFRGSFRNDRKELRLLLSKLVDEMENKDLHYKEFSNAYLELLVLKILRTLKGELIVTNEVQDNKQLNFVKSYMDQHYSREITLDQLANMTYINKFFLVHEFKKQYGVTPIDYLSNKRIDVSKELLLTTDYTMEEIASMIGFNSQSYFNQVFKKKAGLTPTQYKIKNMKNN